MSIRYENRRHAVADQVMVAWEWLASVARLAAVSEGPEHPDSAPDGDPTSTPNGPDRNPTPDVTSPAPHHAGYGSAEEESPVHG